ncbi:hypothetical protein C8Q80DRAFT_827657 [Daedaleopsis nitida]|nr:hypothetical protein C8Q80DRAFT_827657 [Daedaleopsis nitida]
MPQTWLMPRVLVSLTRFKFYPPSGDGSSYPLRLTYTSLIGCCFGILGGFIRVWCHRTLGPFFTWELALRDEHKLITQGPYSIVRHPSYTGWILLTTGNFLLLYSRGSLFRETALSDSIVRRSLAAFATICMGWVWGGIFQRTRVEDGRPDVKGEIWG